MKRPVSRVSKTVRNSKKKGRGNSAVIEGPVVVSTADAFTLLDRAIGLIERGRVRIRSEQKKDITNEVLDLLEKARQSGIVNHIPTVLGAPYAAELLRNIKVGVGRDPKSGFQREHCRVMVQLLSEGDQRSILSRARHRN